MIALTVFAAISLAISATASQSVDSLLYLQNKTLASMVAENNLVELRLGVLPEIGKREQIVQLAERDWRVITQVSKTQFPDTHFITLSVSEHYDNAPVLIRLSTIMGKH